MPGCRLPRSLLRLQRDPPVTRSQYRVTFFVLGAALAIIDGTGPLSTEDWGSHMEYTSKALARLAKTGGPRCCKHDAFSAMD